MEKDIIKLTIPSQGKYISVARLTISSIGNSIGLNIDDIEDIKVCISEACINALDKSENIDIEFKIEVDKLTMKVDKVSQYKLEDMEINKERQLGILIIESLMDEVHFTEEGVEMIKYIEDGHR